MTRKQKRNTNELARSIDAAMELISQGLHDSAWDILTQVHHRAAALGLRSPFIDWAMAVAADNRGDAANAVHHIVLAVAGDPAAPPYARSHRIILGRVQATMADMDPFDPAFAKFYGLLDDLGAVDASAATKMSRAAAASGDHARALALAQRAVDLEPPTAERLQHLARLLAAVGRHDEASARQQEADALTAAFSCPMATA